MRYLIVLRAREYVDTDNIHAPGSPDISIRVSGTYDIEFGIGVGLWFRLPFNYGSLDDRTIALQRTRPDGTFENVVMEKSTANVISQSHVIVRRSLVLEEGDNLRLWFRYKTDEEMLPVIAYKFKLSRVP